MKQENQDSSSFVSFDVNDFLFSENKLPVQLHIMMDSIFNVSHPLAVTPVDIFRDFQSKLQ